MKRLALFLVAFAILYTAYAVREFYRGFTGQRAEYWR